MAGPLCRRLPLQGAELYTIYPSVRLLSLYASTLLFTP
ncbi:hypothetical protein STRTUCAR8_06909, partial [Streptomyces turgidiscabies Car8]